MKHLTLLALCAAAVAQDPVPPSQDDKPAPQGAPGTPDKPVAPEDGPRVRSFRDADPRRVTDDLRQIVRLHDLHEAAPADPLTRAQALASLRKTVDGASKGGAAQIASSEHAGSPRALEAVACAALVHGTPEAAALAKLKEEEESRKVFFGACWRQSFDQLVCGGSRELSGDPKKDALRGDTHVRPAAAEIFDLSCGIDGALPQFKIPSNLEELAGFLKWFPKEFEAAMKRNMDLAGQAIAIAKKMEGAPHDLSHRRALDIERLVNMAFLDPSLVALNEACQKAIKEMTPRLKKAVDPACKEVIEIVKIKDAKVVRAKLIDLSNRTIAVYRPAVVEYDRALRAFFRAAHHHRTGLAANLKDPDWHERVMIYIRACAASDYVSLLTNTSQLGACKFADPDAPAPAEDVKDVEYADPGACPDRMKKFELKVKLGDLVSLTATCEKVGVEVTAWVIPKVLGGFGKVEIGRDTIGVQVGPKLELGIEGMPGSVTVKDGLYLEVGREGLKDVGFMVSATAGMNATPGVKLGTKVEAMKFSFVPSPAR